jgi:hypothetical protein
LRQQHHVGASFANDAIGLLRCPDSKVAGRDLATRCYRGRLGNDECRAAYGATTQVHEVPILREAMIFFVERDAAHRGGQDPQGAMLTAEARLVFDSRTTPGCASRPASARFVRSLTISR